MSEPSDAERGATHPDELLCFAIYSTGLVFSRLYKLLLRDLGLTYPQYLVMIALLKRDGQTVTDISHQLFLESSTLTPLHKRLEASGWIVRRRDDEDERKVRLWLTDQGRSLREKAGDIQQCVSAIVGMSDEELDDIRKRVLAFRHAMMPEPHRNEDPPAPLGGVGP